MSRSSPARRPSWQQLPTRLASAAGGRRRASETCARRRTSSGSSRRPPANDGLSICVTAAGLNRPGPTLEQPIDDFDLIVDTNLRGTYLACRAFAAALEPGRGGRIVAISSQMGEVGYPGRAAYCASKHAVNGLVRALAVEWAPSGSPSTRSRRRSSRRR